MKEGRIATFFLERIFNKELSARIEAVKKLKDLEWEKKILNNPDIHLTVKKRKALQDKVIKQMYFGTGSAVRQPSRFLPALLKEI